MLFFIAAITVYSLAECFLETHSEFVFQHFFNIFHPCRPVEPRSSPALELSSQLYSILFLFPPTFNNNQNFTFSGKFCLQEKKCFHATNFTTQIYQTNTYLKTSLLPHTRKCRSVGASMSPWNKLKQNLSLIPFNQHSGSANN